MTPAHREHLALLAQTLSAERELLELLLFKLVEARLVLTADEPRFVPQAMLEVEAVVDLVSPDYHPLAGLAKDAAAGALVFIVLGSLGVAAAIFVPTVMAQSAI